MNKFGLITNFKAKAGKRDELASMLVQASQLMETAKGSHQYIVYNDVNNDDNLWVSEIWDSKEDHDNSLKIEGCMDLISKAFPLMDGKPEGRTLEVLGGRGFE